jgi:hypothetical protein
MNGTWYPWSESVSPNRLGDYVKAWRRVHDVCRSVGARNATWVWCPNVETAGTVKPLARFYPGNGVNWPIESSSAATTAFAEAIMSPYFAPVNFSSLDTSPIPP